MKKTFKKIWGIGLVLVLLTSLVLSAGPAAAADLAWSAGATPAAAVGGIIAGTQIADMVVAPDGSTIYAAAGATAHKSTNGGASWLPLTTGLATNDLVAIAPDNPNFVVFVDATAAGGFNVALSQDGGATWDLLGSPEDLANAAASAVNDVAITPTVGGVNNILIAGADATPNAALYYFNFGVAVPDWREATTDAPIAGAGHAVSATKTAFQAVAVSPLYQSDFTVLVLSEDSAAIAGLAGGNRIEAVSFNANSFNIGAGFAGYPFLVGTTLGAVTSADIVLEPSYYGGDETLRVGFVAVNSVVATSNGVYRINDNIATDISPATDPTINDIAYDGTTLVAGAAGTPTVYTNAAPLAAGTFAANRATKGPGGVGTVSVGFAGGNIVAASNGNESSFAVSVDGGLTFNGISLVNTTVATIQDIYLSPDGTKQYFVSDDGVDTSLFSFDGTSWQRLIVRIADAGPFLLGVSPENMDVFYLADTTVGRTIFYTDDGAASKWLTRAAPTVGGAGTIADIAVANDTDLYVVVVAAPASTLFYSTSSGFLWNPAPLTTTIPLIASVTSVGEDGVIAGGTAGEAAYSVDGAETWTALPTIAGGAGTNIYAAAESLEDGAVVYCVDSTDVATYSYKLGSAAAAWTNMGNATAGFNKTGVAVTNGAVYSTGVSGANSEVSRFVAGAPANIVAAAGVTFAAAPNTIKITDDNTLTVIDTTAMATQSYSDPLAPASAAPVLTTPVDSYLVPANNITGAANGFTLYWDAVTIPGVAGITYDIQIATDPDFVMVTALGAAGLATPFRIIPAGAVNPGTNYYWRVRVAAPLNTVWSEARSFQVQPMQALVAELASPENGTSVNNVSPGFSWTPIAGATSYQFELSTNAAFATTVFTEEVTSAGAQLPATITLDRGQTYFWRVKALAPVEGEWSTVGNFMVAEEQVQPTQPTGGTETTVTFTQPPATTVTFEIPDDGEDADSLSSGMLWAIIVIGAVLVIALIVLIVRTRRSV